MPTVSANSLFETCAAYVLKKAGLQEFIGTCNATLDSNTSEQVTGQSCGINNKLS